MFTPEVLILIFLLFAYLHVVRIVRNSRGLTSRSGILKILDTSVIIDGRIATFCEAGFMDGTLIVPRFVLRELQQVADSPNKRERGRRGLDVITRLSKSNKVRVVVDHRNFPKIQKVDDKLVELGRITKAKLLTTDFNLSKVAEFQGVEVLNIHELAASLKTFILPGEGIAITIVKRGKEEDQGIAYLDDGTMVVVDKGSQFMDKEVVVEITNVLQTKIGRMVFACIKSTKI